MNLVAYILISFAIFLIVRRLTSRKSVRPQLASCGNCSTSFIARDNLVNSNGAPTTYVEGQSHRVKCPNCQHESEPF